jgi:hypothetical protein
VTESFPGVITCGGDFVGEFDVKLATEFFVGKRRGRNRGESSRDRPVPAHRLFGLSNGFHGASSFRWWFNMIW